MINILVVDDQREQVTFLVETLRTSPKYQVAGTDCPLKALKFCEENKVDIIITDVNMPEMTGIEMIPKLKKINPLSQIIVMTGNSNLYNVMKCLELGVTDYFQKPFKVGEILESIEAIIYKVERWKQTIS